MLLLKRERLWPPITSSMIDLAHLLQVDLQLEQLRQWGLLLLLLLLVRQSLASIRTSLR